MRYLWITYLISLLIGCATTNRSESDAAFNPVVSESAEEASFFNEALNEKDLERFELTVSEKFRELTDHAQIAINTDYATVFRNRARDICQGLLSSPQEILE